MRWRLSSKPRGRRRALTSEDLADQIRQLTAERNLARKARDELAETMLGQQILMAETNAANERAQAQAAAANERVEQLERILANLRAQNERLTETIRELRINVPYRPLVLSEGADDE